MNEADKHRRLILVYALTMSNWTSNSEMPSNIADVLDQAWRESPGYDPDKRRPMTIANNIIADSILKQGYFKPSGLGD